jgi:DNA invertase Pin-like site-specific DNA recombinase
VAIRYTPIVSGTLIGYARCSTDTQDLTAQRDRLRELGVAGDRIYLDHGLTGTSRKRPGLDQALAAVREGDTLVVPKLDRLARSVPDARGIRLSLGGQVYDPADPMGKMFVNILATFAEFEAGLLRMRTREGMAVARAKGRLQGRQPKLSAKQQAELRRMHASGDYSIADLAELFTVSRPTVYRTLQRSPASPRAYCPAIFRAAWSIGLAHWPGSASRRVWTATAYSLPSSQAPLSRTAGAFRSALPAARTAGRAAFRRGSTRSCPSRISCSPYRPR